MVDHGDVDPIGSWSMTEGLDEILRKSSGLMAKRGFHGTSMRDLAQETGRSLSGLYHYFKSKEDLLFLINVYGFTTLCDAWTKLEGEAGTPYEKLYAFVFLHVTYFVEHVDEMRVMTWGTHALGLEKARTIQKQKDRYGAIAEDIVREVRKADGKRPLEDRQLAREVFLLFGMMNWMPSWYRPREHGTAGELIDDIYRTYLSGISRAVPDEDNLIRLREMLRERYRKNKTGSMWDEPGRPRHDRRDA